MATAIADLEILLKDIPAGAWVAISESKNQVISFGPDPQLVIQEAHDKGEPQPLLTRVPERTATMFF